MQDQDENIFNMNSPILAQILIDNDYLSISLLQRKLFIGHSQAKLVLKTITALKLCDSDFIENLGYKINKDVVVKFYGS